jgi:hypothetical protein
MKTLPLIERMLKRLNMHKELKGFGKLKEKSNGNKHLG